MQRIARIAFPILALSLLICILSACSIATTANIGKTVSRKHRIALSEHDNNTSTWQTNDLLVNYTIKNSAEDFSVSGTIHIKESILGSFPAAEAFNLFINFIDHDGIVISTHDISPVFGYRLVVPEQVGFKFDLTQPADAAFFTFSYSGTFRSIGFSGEAADEWEIVHEPFTTTP